MARIIPLVMCIHSPAVCADPNHSHSVDPS